VPSVVPILGPIPLPCGTRCCTLSLSGRAPANSPTQLARLYHLNGRLEDESSRRCYAVQSGLRSCTLMGTHGLELHSALIILTQGQCRSLASGLGGGGQQPTGSPGLSTTSRRSQRCAAAARTLAFTQCRPGFTPGCLAIALTAVCARGRCNGDGTRPVWLVLKETLDPTMSV
jgi:hypothetical protein